MGGLFGHAARHITEVGGEDIGNAGETRHGEGEGTGGHGEVGVNHIGFPFSSQPPGGEKTCDEIKRHLRHRAGVLALTQAGRAHDFHTVDFFVGGKMRQAGGLHRDVVSAAGQLAGHLRGHPSAAAAQGRILVAEDEDFHAKPLRAWRRSSHSSKHN